jgi:hypothetical protein
MRGERRDDAQAEPLVDQPIEVIGLGHRNAARRRHRWTLIARAGSNHAPQA